MATADTAFLVSVLAHLLQGRRHVAVGANLPIPASAALLAQRLSGGALRVDILGSRKFDALPGLGGLYDFACQGRYDGFFLSPGQIDGAANINLVGVGNYPRLSVRWPGSHGSPLLYMMIPNIVLFRDVHRRRALVPTVDFISATGVSPANVYRPGGPTALVTDMGRFSFDRATARFKLESVHPGRTVEQITENTGFTFDHAIDLCETPAPNAATLDLIRREIVDEIAQIYPRFAAELAASAAR